VQPGDKLPRRVIGPHSIASFTTEYRAFLFSIWGTFGGKQGKRYTIPPSARRPGPRQDTSEEVGSPPR
jgi:hypothetical protein